MKSSAIIFIALSLLAIGKASGQTYQGFPTVDGYWKVQYGNVNCLDNHYVSDLCSEYQYIVTGDTLITNNIYHKINLSGRNRFSINFLWTYWDSGYEGCYRNNLTSKKVFFIPKDSLNEVLLYDFNLNLNDTLPETYVYNQAIYTTITVDLIDSILVNNTYLKRYHLDNAGFGWKYLIEGIGSTFGLLSPITPFFEFHYDLLCFKNNQDDLYYFDYDSTDCDIINSVNNIDFSLNGIQIFPNPTSNYITIENPLNERLLIEIYNSKGQRIKTIEKTENTFTINVSNMHQGLYFIRINSNGNWDKIVKLIKE